MDEERLPGGEVRGLEDVGPHRAGHLGQRRGGDEVDAGREREDLPGVDADLLGVPATGEQRADLVADRPQVDPFPDRVDPAAHLEAGVLRGAGRWWVEAHPLHDVGTVDPRGGDGDPDLAGTGLGVGTSAGTRASASPGRGIVIARMPPT